MTISYIPLMRPVAERLLGEMNKRLSNGVELRFGSNGSMSINLATGQWYDHERREGGGVLDLIQRELKGDRAGARTWLIEQGLVQPEPKPERPREPEHETETNTNGLGRSWPPTFYDYRDADGSVLFRVERKFPKRFFQHGPDGSGGFVSRKGCMARVRLIPYRLPELIGADPTRVIFVCEGEKDADKLARLGMVATCNPGGAGKWSYQFGRHFKGRRVIVLADNDDAGRSHAADVCSKLREEAAEVAVLELPGLPEKGDVSDWLDNGGNAEELKRLAETAFSHPHYAPERTRAHLHTPPEISRETDILAVLLAALRLCGVRGEERNAKLMFLALTSRLLDEPVSLVVKGLSSSGKSFTLGQVVKFFPPEAVIALTGMSERTLVYSEEEFSHRTILLYEASALREQREKTDGNQTAYFLRSLLSEGRIDYAVTVRDKAKGFVTRKIVKTGPTNVIITTTALDLHSENETRMLSLLTDDSSAQTRAIMIASATGSVSTVDYAPWHDLQYWLAGSKVRAVVPFAPFIAESIPPVAVRLRRDFRSILRLIETHAILHQATREKDDRGRIIATPADYEAIRALVADLISAGVGATVPATVQETVEAVAALAETQGVKIDAIAARLKIDRSAAQRRLATARGKGFIVNLEDKRGKPSRYFIGEPMPGEIEIMPSVEAVTACTARCTHECTAQTAENSDDPQGCAGVHAVHGGILRMARPAHDRR